MQLEDALMTTGAVREFADRPVAPDVVYRILDAARFAPSGGNRQAWRVVLVQDHATRERLRNLYASALSEYQAIAQAGLVPWAPVTDRKAEEEAVRRAAEVPATRALAAGFPASFDQVPVLLALFADLRALAAVDRDLDRYTLVGGASIYPFAWSVLLAAHEHGLGGVITTLLVRHERTVCELLGVPDGHALAAVIALGYPDGPRPTKLTRTRVEQFATIDRHDGPSLTDTR
jgi:nitroreductase